MVDKNELLSDIEAFKAQLPSRKNNGERHLGDDDKLLVELLRKIVAALPD